MEIKGIDISSYQGKPDWKKVKKAGIKYAILRIHQRYGIDASFEYNYKECDKNGIPVGVYKYSYALNVAQAEDEADSVISVLNGRKLDFPVFYDLEWKEQRVLSKQTIEKIAKAFLSKIAKAGYMVGIYCNADWYQNVLTPDLKKYDCWVARYPLNDNGGIQERLRPDFGIGWQYSSKGHVDGVNGNVDMNVFYKDYKKTEGDAGKVNLWDKAKELLDNQVGYLEKRSNANLDSKTGNAGYGNYTKYSRDVNNWGLMGCQGQPWCATYQFWICVKTSGKAKALEIMGNGFYNCNSVKAHSRSKGTWHSSPKVGALVIFRNGAHIGRVIRISGNTIYTNEGNTSSGGLNHVEANGGCVAEKSYTIGNSQIDGYVWIDYGEAADKPEKPWKATGTATSTVDNLFVRAEPNGEVIGELMKGNRFEINGIKDGFWTQVNVAEIGVGWVWTAYVKKDGSQSSEPPKQEISNKQDKTQRLFVGKVTASVLNVRTWAGTEYPQIKSYPTLNKGNLVDVMNFTHKAADGEPWYYIRIDGKYHGFVSAKYILKQ